MTQWREEGQGDRATHTFSTSKKDRGSTFCRKDAQLRLTKMNVFFLSWVHPELHSHHLSASFSEAPSGGCTSRRV